MWQWKKDGVLEQDMNNTKVCRDFGAIKERTQEAHFNLEIEFEVE